MNNKTGLTIVVLLILVLIAGAALITGLTLMSKSSPYADQGSTPSGIVPKVVPNNIVETQNFASLRQIPVKAIDEIAKSNSAEEMSRIKGINDAVLDANSNIESRKKAVQELAQLESIEVRDSVSLLLDDLTEIKKSGSSDKKNSEIVGYITVTLDELYKQTNKSASAKKEDSSQTALSENTASVTEIPAETSAEAVSLPESTALETTTQKSLIELANLKLDTAGSLDKLEVILFDKDQPQAVKLLGLKRLAELDAKTSLPVFETLFLNDSAVSDNVIMATAIKAVYDMNTAGAFELLEKTAQSSKNTLVKETIEFLLKK